MPYTLEIGYYIYVVKGLSWRGSDSLETKLMVYIEIDI